MDPSQIFTLNLHDLFVGMSVIELLLAVPLGFILKRAGFSPFWALFSFFPIVGFPALWLFAFIRWPRDARQ